MIYLLWRKADDLLLQLTLLEDESTTEKDLEFLHDMKKVILGLEASEKMEIHQNQFTETAVPSSGSLNSELKPALCHCKFASKIKNKRFDHWWSLNL